MVNAHLARAMGRALPPRDDAPTTAASDTCRARHNEGARAPAGGHALEVRPNVEEFGTAAIDLAAGSS